jgi:membrane protease subunit HflK
MPRLGILLVAAAAVLYGLTGVVQVLPGERAVVRRFGRVLDEKPKAGLWIGLPWGMDRVDRVAVDRVQRVAVGFQDNGDDRIMPAGQLLTGDHNLVNVQATIFYKVRPDEVVEFVLAQDRVDALLTRAAECALAEWIGSQPVDEVLLRGKRDLGPILVQRTRELLEVYRIGIDVLDARVGLIAPPEEVKHAFDEVARAQTSIVTLRNRAEQEAEAALRDAQAEQYRQEQKSAAYAHEQRVLAREDAGRFAARLEQYRAGVQRNPQYLRQIWEEERGRVFRRLKDNGQLGLLDDRLGPDGLDLSVAPPTPQR